MIITGVSRSDAGVYACELSTHAQLRHQLVVTSAPVILQVAARLGGRGGGGGGGGENREWIDESDENGARLGASG